MENTVVPLPSRPAIIRLDLIDRDPGQPRQDFDDDFIDELAASIKKTGMLINPIYVRPHPVIEGRYIIVAGEQRTRALRKLGVEEFEFRITEKSIPPYLASIIENAMRKDLNPIETAHSYRECMEREGMSAQEVADYAGKNVNEIYQSLRFLTLAPEVQQLVRDGKLTKGGTKHLTQYKNLAKQIEFAQQLIRGETPPEMVEASTVVSAWAEDRIIASIPKTPEGIIRRALTFRGHAHRASFLFDAFLALSEDQQIEGWKQFTEGTRKNFVDQMSAFGKKLTLLNARMTNLPATKRVPSGNALPSTQRTSDAGSDPFIRNDPQPAGVPKSTQKMGPPPSPPEIKVAMSVLNCLSNSLRQRSDHLLSKARFKGVIGDDGQSPAEIEKATLTALRDVRDAWRASPQDGDPQEYREFVMFVSRRRHELGDMQFPALIAAISARDKSPDPVNLERL